MKDFYEELDRRLKSAEKYHSEYSNELYAIADKIEWCWKWKKITEEQKNELADRMTTLFEEGR